MFGNLREHQANLRTTFGNITRTHSN